MNEIIKYIADKIGDYHTAYRLYESLKYEYFHQLNDQTKISELNDYYQRQIVLPLPPDAQPQHEIRIVKEPLPGWKAMLWRIWQAILPDAPDHGYKVKRKHYPAPMLKRIINLETYGIELSRNHYDYWSRLSVFIRCGYDSVNDILYVMDVGIRDY